MGSTQRLTYECRNCLIGSCHWFPSGRNYLGPIWLDARLSLSWDAVRPPRGNRLFRRPATKQGAILARLLLSFDAAAKTAPHVSCRLNEECHRAAPKRE